MLTGPERDLCGRGQRQPRHAFAVGTDFVEASPIAADRWTMAFELAQVPEVRIKARSEAGVLESLPDGLEFLFAPRLVIPRRIGASFEIQELGQLANARTRQQSRIAEHMQRVERDDAEDSQRRSWRRAEEERQAAQQAQERDEGGLERGSLGEGGLQV